MFDQLYYTHCTAATSKIGQAEYSVRAASLPREEISNQLVQSLTGLTAYRLPIEMSGAARSGKGLRPDEAPFRLARLPMPDGHVAAVAAAYSSRDSTGNARSFFSHVILPSSPEALTARQVIELWGSDGAWGSSSDLVWNDPKSPPLTDSHDLPKWSPQHGAGLLRLAGLQSVLRSETPPDTGRREALDLAPQRLCGKPQSDRLQHFVEMLPALYLNRGGVYLVAEPGLAALLIYALIRCLPPEMANPITFSTYEQYHTTYKNCCAEIVSTYRGENAEPPMLDADFPGQSGFLDTFAEPIVQQTDIADELAYVRYAQQLIIQDRLQELESHWRRWRQGEEEGQLRRKSLIANWRRELRVRTTDRRVLTDEEIAAYLAQPQWRARLWESAQGRRQTVQFLVRNHDQPADWWSAAGMRSHLHEFRELIVAKYAEMLLRAEKGGQAENRLVRLIRAIADEHCTRADLWLRAVDHMENEAGEDSLRQCEVSFRARAVALQIYVKRKIQPAELPIRCKIWLTVVEPKTLVQISELGFLPRPLKVVAFGNSLLAGCPISDELATTLAADPDLFTDVVVELLNQAGERKSAAQELCAEIFTAVDRTELQARLFLALLERDCLRKDKRAAALFEPLARVGISVDTIVQNTSSDRTTDISFTVSRTDLPRAESEVKLVIGELGSASIVTDSSLAAVSVVGSGMQNTPGYASRMFRVLADGNINIDMITTSEIRISCIIREDQAEEAVRLL
ncbi:MAG: ACT domain-containing protein, partial [Planctomycetes bacterium]|nr:ACT domain-containing protein [Planctomycetota bacterium]